jgi:hypothetical protein
MEASPPRFAAGAAFIAGGEHPGLGLRAAAARATSGARRERAAPMLARS